MRLVHPSARGCVVVVPGARPYATPLNCPTCNTRHEVKTYHLVLDGEGACVVSPGVFAGLRQVNMGPMLVESEVPNPPAQTLKLVTPGVR